VALSSGTRLGAYEILSLIGSGGMGEVYRARDMHLKRDVAIKVLADAFAADPDRLARFQREAELLATLSHTNIAAVYGLEKADGITGIVLELIEGATLTDVIARGPLALSDALPIARQIAEALEAAHEKGVIHRDLKPANIKVTPDGKVKVLDFGLAKATDVASGPSLDTTNSPTITSPAMMTEIGVVLGTAPYMAPEQAKGRAVDKRADIWAFGCIVFELLTGQRAFAGKDAADVFVAILTTEPDWNLLPPATPSRMADVLQRCLKKDAHSRLRDVGDARLELEMPDIPPRADQGTRRVSTIGWMLAGVLIGSAAVSALWYTRSKAIVVPNVSHQRLTDFVGMEEFPAISPDGKTVAFTARVHDRRQIWLRLLVGGTPLQVTNDDADHQEPRWAPDSSAIIYYTGADVPETLGTLWEVPALGGTPRRIASASGGGDISPDGRRLAMVQAQHERSILVIAGRDGVGVRSYSLPAEYNFESPRWSPDGQSIALQSDSITDFDKHLYVIALPTGEQREITRADDMKGLAWLPDGSGLVYSSSFGSTVLYPPTFNLRIVGHDGRGDRQLTFGDVSYQQPDVGRSGVVVVSRIHMQSDIWRIPSDRSPADNARNAVRITQQTGQVQVPSLSPDGREMVYLSDSGGHGNLWTASTDGTGIARQITFERDPSVSIGVPVWSPAGDRIVFIRNQEGRTGLWLVGPDGGGIKELVPRATWACWSPNGRWLYYQPSINIPLCIEKIPADGGTPVRVRCDNAGAPAVSDGGTLFYASALSAGVLGWTDFEIRVATPETGAPRTLARIAVGRIPISPLLFHMFLSPDRQWLALPLTDGGTTNLWAVPVTGGAPRPITDFGRRAVVIARRVSWAPDGKSIYAAIADIDADVVLLTGLIR
jgi:serine/threonine protein kinase/Tol biopolymer transport system component